ncbi:MAG: hypothetical protein AAGG56_03240 [Pseudomonadota bacterium]
MRRFAFATMALFVAMTSQVVGQDTDEAQNLSLELDSLTQVETSCRLTFVARSSIDVDLTSLVLEAVAFNVDGGVARIALFDFGALPASGLRVRQFDLPDMECAAVETILINGIDTCEGADDCADRLAVSSRATADLIQ